MAISRTLVALPLLLAPLAIYPKLLRPKLMNLGASNAEIEREMAMDDDIAAPTVVTNRAITIDAPPELVWPWLPQMGELPRAGFYSFLTVERVLGMKVENADVIMPEYQHPQVGEALDRGGSMLVKGITPGESIVLGPRKGLAIDSTWAIAVYPDGIGGTRLISRLRIRYARWTPFNILAFLMLEPGQLIMERKMLVEIKKRAERLAREAERTPVGAASVSD